MAGGLAEFMAVSSSSSTLGFILFACFSCLCLSSSSAAVVKQPSFHITFWSGELLVTDFPTGSVLGRTAPTVFVLALVVAIYVYILVVLG